MAVHNIFIILVYLDTKLKLIIWCDKSYIYALYYIHIQNIVV